MSEPRLRISLQHFLIAGTILPVAAAFGAGVFGELAATIFWIVVTAGGWFTLLWLAVAIVSSWRRKVAKRRADSSDFTPQISSE